MDILSGMRKQNKGEITKRHRAFTFPTVLPKM